MYVFTWKWVLSSNIKLISYCGLKSKCRKKQASITVLSNALEQGNASMCGKEPLKDEETQ